MGTVTALQPATSRLPLPGGGHAALEAAEGSTVLRVYSRDTLVIEYDPVTHRTRVMPEAGDLELAAPAGNLALRAEGSVTIDAGAVAVRSRSGIGLAVEAARLLAEVASLRLVAGRVETLAKTVVEKTRNLYRAVEELLETRAGRVRSLVDGTYHLKARDAVVRAERDVDVDGEKIRLG